MPWHSLTNLTTVKSLDMRDNFDVIGAGSRLPMSSEGVAFANTTGVYDIGSSAFRWNNIFATNLDVTGDITTDNGSLEVLIAETTLSVTASNIEFTGLNGDTDVIYLIRAYIVATTTALEIYAIFNNDSATANYGWQYLIGYGSAVGAGRFTTWDGISLTYTGSDTTTSNLAYSESIIYAKTGNERLVIVESIDMCDATYIGRIVVKGAIWNNTTSTITSLKILNSGGVNFAAGTNIQLWAKK